jgi:hypothetical protein
VTVFDFRHSGMSALEIIVRKPVTGAKGFLGHTYCDNDLEEISETEK